MKHTPGPWIYKSYGKEGVRYIGAVFHRDELGPCVFRYEAAWPIKMADVQLMISAPELLESLKNALARLEAYEGVECNADLRAILAKAEGK